ncbi:MAG: hypothetical protein U9O98_08830, partial [Asgard group archaeon]|nr:hypothetical protein [Asgard group archaeon]
MSREIKQLHKNYHDMSQNEIWDTIRKIRTKANLQANTKQARDLAQILYELFDLPVMTEKISNQLILLNQLIELVEWTKKDKKILNLLVQSIQKIPIVNHSITKEERLNIFKKLSQMMKKFPENTSLLDAASQVIVEIIRRSQDQEILSIISQMKEITMNNPLNEAIQLLHARVYMNAFFYLTIQDITIIDRLYEEFSCFALSKSTDENLPQCQIKKLYIVENINEIFQEGIINAIINLARIRKQRENDCDECLNLIRKILTDSEQFLRKEEEDQSFFKDVYRLLYAFEQFNLWDHFQDIPLINELKQLQEKSMENKKAQTKLLAIRKLMRIDEYDALKIGRRGLLLKYDFGNPDNIKVLINDIRNHLEKEKDFFLVEKVDAIISQDSKIEKSLREKGYIPQDKKTISEIQDRTTKDDDLTQSAVQEIKLVEPLNFLRNINRNMEKNLPNQIAYAKGHIFAVGMFGYNSKTLQIKKEETKEIIITIENTMMMLEIIEPLTRAITLRAGRLDANATEFLLPFLTQHGLKFLSKIYSNYPFVSNLTRLLSYLGRTSQID